MNEQLLFWIILAVLYGLLLRIAFQKRRPFHAIAFSMMSGLLTLFPVSFFLEQSGYFLEINAQTLSFSAVLGIPGVLAMAGFCVFF